MNDMTKCFILVSAVAGLLGVLMILLVLSGFDPSVCRLFGEPYFDPMWSNYSVSFECRYHIGGLG